MKDKPSSSQAQVFKHNLEKTLEVTGDVICANRKQQKVATTVSLSGGQTWIIVVLNFTFSK